METVAFDNVKFEKEKAIARFDLFRRISKLWHIFQLFLIFCLISFCSPRLNTVSTLVYFSAAYLCNPHLIFFIGNAIIVFLFMLCRENDVAGDISTDYDDCCYNNDYVDQTDLDLQYKVDTHLDHKEIVEENQIQVLSVAAEEKQIVAISQCDDLAAVIDKAKRQIKRFERTQSERLRREIAVRPKSEKFRRTMSSGVRQESAAMQSLSDEEFQRTVDDFIDKHWRKKEEDYRLAKMKM